MGNEGKFGGFAGDLAFGIELDIDAVVVKAEGTDFGFIPFGAFAGVPVGVKVDVVEVRIVGDEAASDVGDSFGFKLVCPVAEDLGDVSLVIEIATADAGIAAAVNDEVAVKDSVFDGAGGVEFCFEFEVRAEEGHACGGGDEFVVGSGDYGAGAEDICGNGAIGICDVDGYCGFEAGIFDDLLNQGLQALGRLGWGDGGCGCLGRRGAGRGWRGYLAQCG